MDNPIQIKETYFDDEVPGQNPLSQQTTAKESSPYLDEINMLPKLPKMLSDEIRRSFITRQAKKLQERKTLIARAVKRRDSRQALSNLDNTMEKDHPSENESLHKHASACIDKDTNATNAVLTDRKAEQSLLDDSTGLQDLSDTQMPSSVQHQNDDHARIVESVQLQIEIRVLKAQLHTKDAQTSLLREQVNDLTIETKSLSKKLSKWQTKSQKISELQKKERVKLENSTDLITQARIGLTKALNDASKLEAKVFDLEAIVDERNRRVEHLYETIERQTQKIHKMNTKIRDKETVLRLNENEKRKLEEEIQVLIASRDERDTGKTLRRLEREREEWLSNREQKIEEAKIELENDNNKSHERERHRHRQEQEILKKNSERRKEIEEKQQKTQECMNQQLNSLMEANRELHQKLTKEREEMASEIEEQDATIAAFESQVHNLKKRLSTQNHSEDELIFRKAGFESMKEELQNAQGQNELLLERINDLLTDDNIKMKPLQKRSKSRGRSPAARTIKKEKSKRSLKETKKKKKKKTKNKMKNESTREPNGKTNKRTLDRAQSTKNSFSKQSKKSSFSKQSNTVTSQETDTSSIVIFVASSNRNIEQATPPKIPRSILCSPIQ